MYAKFIESDGRFAFELTNNGGFEITPDAHDALMAGQAAGKCIVPDSSGKPVLSDPPAPTQAQQLAQYTAGAQAAIDAGAQSWGYDSILSAASYAASTNAQFKAEAAALIGWRDEVWMWAQAQESAIKAGTVTLPATVAAFVAGMPALPMRPTVS